MADAMHLLFLKEFGAKTLFRNQFDLVQNLLNDPRSKYYFPNKETDEYIKRQSRLKAYISQLLSSSVSRNITDEFSKSLFALLEKKLQGTDFNPQNVFSDIVQSLKAKNTSSIKAEAKYSVPERIYTELYAANYIAVITSRPLELGINLEARAFSFQRYLLNDLMQTFINPNKKLKNYRFNFPLQSFCELFWKELRKFVRFYIQRKIHEESLYAALKSNYKLSHNKLSLLKLKDLAYKDLEEIVDCVLEYLNTNKHMLVFHVTAPIYSMPLLAINPDDPKTASLYAMLEDSNQGVSIHRYQKEDFMLWRLFVWDNLKTNVNSKPVKYTRTHVE